MPVTTFLSSDSLWAEIQAKVKAAKHVDAAIAYLAKGGAARLPLRKNARLVVDMSLATVSAGATNPWDVERLMKRGVKVFTRRHLHAKVIVADGTLIASSANVSIRSETLLEEAGITTIDPVAVQRARAFIDRLCLEPVRSEYLELCKKTYRNPSPGSGGATPTTRQGRVAHSKLWIANVREAEIPENEYEQHARHQRSAEKLKRNPSNTRVTSLFWPHEPSMARQLQQGDWVIRAVRDSHGTIRVHAPGQLLAISHYERPDAPGKHRWVFFLEIPARGATMSWSDFRRASKSLSDTTLGKAPRTKAVRTIEDADKMLRIWTPAGRLSRR